jgi:hypothetical protein
MRDKKEKGKIYFWTFFIIFIVLGLYFFGMYFFSEQLLIHIGKSLNILSWIFTFFLGAIIPGLIYGGGKGYTKLKKGKFIIKEKGFLYRLLDIFLISIILLFTGFLFSWIFTLIEKYVILLIVELILFSYVAYCRDHEFNFPWIYFIGINIVNLFLGYLIFRFI